jgi:hypothetical protein
VARAAGRARSQRFRVTSERRSKPVIRGGAPGASARRESQTLGVRPARAEEREGIRGPLRAAGRLTKKLPSPALKEGERFGSYNSGALNTLMRGTVQHGTVQGQIAGRATCRALRLFAHLKGYAQGKQGVFETLMLRTGGVY